MVIPTLGKGKTEIMEIKNLDIETLSQESEKILKTLPLANYLKVSTIKVNFDKTSQTSFFDSSNFSISVSLNNIANAIKGSKKKTLTPLDLEKHIRCFLYHELSHAILTPADLMGWASFYAQYPSKFIITPQLANILEDERIETILKNYYHGVDFKQNLHNICKLETAETFEQFVFNAVRFRYSPVKSKNVNINVKQFISACKEVNAKSDDSVIIPYMEGLLRYLKGIWDEICEKQKEAQEQNQQQNQDSQGEEDDSSSNTENQNDNSSNEEEENGNENDSSNDESEEEENQNEESQESPSNEETEESSKEDAEESGEINGDTFKEEDSESGMSEEEIENLFNSAVYKIKESQAQRKLYSLTMNDLKADRKVKAELLKVIIRNCGVGVNQSQAQFGYSGRFNAKRFMKDANNSYKWFEKKAYEENQRSKKSSKKILNIWLDQSGSFLDNDEPVNKILKALYEIEKSRDDFEFNLVRVDTHFIIERDKEKRVSLSRGSNALPKEEIENCYKELNKTKKEYNIMLFDGPVGIIGIKGYDYENLKVFDNDRSIFITEESNTEPIKKVCKNAREIIEENTNYAETLANNVIKALDLLF